MSDLNNSGVLVLPQDMTEIAVEAFTNREDLVKVVIPAGVTHIGAAAFAGCENLERVELPHGLQIIGTGAFLDCVSLREVLFPDSLRQIEPMAFWNSGLEQVTVPAQVESIGENAFWSCEKLRRADVLGKNTQIGVNAFGSNYGLLEGYIAPGYPAEQSAPAELLYTLLWCSCPDRHDATVSQRAEELIHEKEMLIMERILKYNNIPAMTGLARRHLLRQENIDGYVRCAIEAGQVDLTALLLEAKGTQRMEEEFAL